MAFCCWCAARSAARAHRAVCGGLASGATISSAPRCPRRAIALRALFVSDALPDAVPNTTPDASALACALNGTFVCAIASAHVTTNATSFAKTDCPADTVANGAAVATCSASHAATAAPAHPPAHGRSVTRRNSADAPAGLVACTRHRSSRADATDCTRATAALWL